MTDADFKDEYIDEELLLVTKKVLGQLIERCREGEYRIPTDDLQARANVFSYLVGFIGVREEIDEDLYRIGHEWKYKREVEIQMAARDDLDLSEVHTAALTLKDKHERAMSDYVNASDITEEEREISYGRLVRNLDLSIAGLDNIFFDINLKSDGPNSGI